VGVASAAGAGMFVLAWPEEQADLPGASLVLGEGGEFPWRLFGE
jgi:hypothetical protein